MLSAENAGRQARKKSSTQAATAPARGNGLSDEIIVNAALDLAKRVGVNRITMRDLATELGVTTMATYWHLKNKKMLLQAVLDAVLSRVPDANQLEGTWAERVVGSTLASVEELTRWPGICHAFDVAGTEGPQALRLSSALVATLREAGFDADEAQMAASLIGTWSLGYIDFDEARRGSQAARPLTPITGRTDASSDRFDVFALEVIVEGLQSRLDRRG